MQNVLENHYLSLLTGSIRITLQRIIFFLGLVQDESGKLFEKCSFIFRRGVDISFGVVVRGLLRLQDVIIHSRPE